MNSPNTMSQSVYFNFDIDDLTDYYDDTTLPLVSSLIDIRSVGPGDTVEVLAELIEARAVLILETLGTLSVATVGRSSPSSQKV